MEHHGDRLPSFRAQHHVTAVDLAIVACSVGCKQAPEEFRQRHALPSTGAQEFVRRRHRMEAPLKRLYEIGNRVAPMAGVGDDSSDGGECVLDAMVKLGVQASSR